MGKRCNAATAAAVVMAEMQRKEGEGEEEEEAEELETAERKEGEDGARLVVLDPPRALVVVVCVSFVLWGHTDTDTECRGRNRK